MYQTNGETIEIFNRNEFPLYAFRKISTCTEKIKNNNIEFVLALFINITFSISPKIWQNSGMTCTKINK